MIRTLLKGFTALLIVLAIIVVWAITLNKPKQQHFEHYSLPLDIRTLPQNWTADIRQQVSHTSFGSRLVPLHWLLNLEQPFDRQQFLDPEHIRSLGFIPQQHATNNTYGLPVGFSIDYKHDVPWVGLTCAACHTALIEHQGQKILIDGGAGKLHFSAFERSLFNAITLTIEEPERFARFSRTITSTSEKELKTQLIEWQKKMARHLAINQTDTPYGHGRLDAFGIIFNAVAVKALGVATNVRTPDAPVSIPVLWDAPHFDVVQWNGSAPNREPGPLGQNIPTAIGVYADLEMGPEAIGGYSSSVRVKNLGYLQHSYAKLTAPKWPEDLLGKLDSALVAKGQTLYETHCLSCHALSRNNSATAKYRTTLIPASEVGTDLAMVTNFTEQRVSSGFLEGRKTAIITGPPLEAEVSPVDLVINAAAGVMLKKPFSTLSAVATQYESNYPPPKSRTSKVYKARPLNGIWTSGPYLHNGSVPTLWDLLQPPQQRPTQFFTGSIELDVKRVGYSVNATSDNAARPYASSMDTRLYGNSNAGHRYGTALSNDEKWALIEYLKSL
ncbi:MAG TPA: di-heme-cytochrome C peroxidase [Marinagarivorans sp.]